jgi:thioesterase domain-containing protein/aryl carrier-like protein
MEAELTKLWEELLTVSPIHKRDDFFEIGGHSLLALRFLARIEKQYGKKISLATLFQSPTIEKFTGILLGETTSAVETPGIGKLQPLGVKPAFFWVNGWPTIRNLALEIGTDQPFYTVNLPDDHDLTPPYNVAEIAARYIRIIQEAQPHGPYMLGGWCRAGLIAYEIAQQLQKQGEEIALVGLFDTWSPTYLTRYSDSEARRARMQLRWERFRFHGKNVLTKGFREAIAYTIYHLRNIQDRFKVSSLRRSYRLKNMLGLSIAKQSYTETEMIFLATNDYRPKAFSGRTILFRFDEYKDWKYWDPNLGWGEYLAGDLEVHEVPGRHNSEYFFTGPHLAAVARAMANAVNGGPIPSSASRPKLQQIEPSATATLSRS